MPTGGDAADQPVCVSACGPSRRTRPRRMGCAISTSGLKDVPASADAPSLAKSGGTISRSSSWSEGEETELEVALRSGESAILRRVKSGRREHLQLEIKALKV